MEKGITYFEVCYIDETDFRIGFEIAQFVITLDANKLSRMIDPDNCEYITSINCICSVGKTISPIFLISKVNILYK